MLVPSQWEEPFCRVPIEAGFSKIPTIDSKTGGLIESVGEGGILIEQYGNLDMWTSVLKEVFFDEDHLKKLGEQAYNHAQKFISDVMIEKVYEILVSVI